MSKFGLNLKLAFGALIICMSVLTSCNHDNVTTAASNAIANRDFRQAITDILALSDKDILKSDTLSQLLSSAYYGLTLKPERGIAGDCYDLDFTPDNRMVAVTDFETSEINFFKYPEMVPASSIALPRKPYGAAITPDGSILAAALGSGKIYLFDTKTGEKLDTLPAHTHAVRDVVFLDDSVLFSCGNDRTVAAWNIKAQRCYWEKKCAAKNIKSLQLSKDKTKLVMASNDGSATIIDVTDNKKGVEKMRVVHSDNYVNDAALSPDNSLLVTVGGDGFVKIWDAGIGYTIAAIPLDEPLTAVDISPDGRYILAGGNQHVFIIDAMRAIDSSTSSSQRSGKGFDLKRLFSLDRSIDSNQGEVTTKIYVAKMPVWCVKFLNDTDFVYADNSRLEKGTLLTGQDLIDAARSLAAKSSRSKPIN